MTHSTVSQSPPGDGDQDGVGEAGRDKDRIEKLGSGSPGLPAARLLFQKCGEQSIPFIPLFSTMAAGAHTSALGLGPLGHCLIILLFLQNACSVGLQTSLFLTIGYYGLLPSLEASPSQSQFLPCDQLNKHLRQFLLSWNSSFQRALGWLPAYHPRPLDFRTLSPS